MYELKDYLNAINFSKEKLLDTDDVTWEKKYSHRLLLIAVCLCIKKHSYIANEMNINHQLLKNFQFHFFINSIRKKKRFGGKWLSQSKVKDLDAIKEYYGYSNAKPNRH